MRIKKADELLAQTMKEKDIQAGWTIGTLGHGRYAYFENGKQKVFDERSMTIDIVGVPMEAIHRIADLILERFNQNAVLIKDNKTNENYIWSRGEEQKPVSRPEFS